jgi:hypothetical protein
MDAWLGWLDEHGKRPEADRLISSDWAYAVRD